MQLIMSFLSFNDYRVARPVFYTASNTASVWSRGWLVTTQDHISLEIYALATCLPLILETHVYTKHIFFITTQIPSTKLTSLHYITWSCAMACCII